MEDEVVLVTGAGGLIGHALRGRLEARGTKVVPIDRMARTADGIDLVEADVGDIHRLHALIAGRMASPASSIAGRSRARWWRRTIPTPS